MRKFRHRKVEKSAKGHIGNKCLGQDSNPDTVTLRAVLLTNPLSSLCLSKEVRGGTGRPNSNKFFIVLSLL